MESPLTANQPALGQMINVQAYKHNGHLYRQWNGAKVIANTQTALVLLMIKTKVSDAARQRWTIREPVIWFFPKTAWYNTTALIRAHGVLYYSNLASPPVFEDNTVKYIDYDLDVKAYPNHRVRVVDKREFIINSVRYHYPSRIKHQVEQTTQHIIDAVQRERGFFNPQLISTYLQMLVESKQLSPALDFAPPELPEIKQS